MLRVTPINPKIVNDKNMDNGIAIPTNKALRNPRKNYSTVITSMIPKIMLFSKSETMVRVSFD